MAVTVVLLATLAGCGGDDQARGFGTTGQTRSGHEIILPQMDEATNMAQFQTSFDPNQGGPLQQVVDQLEAMDGVREVRVVFFENKTLVGVRTIADNPMVREEIERVTSGYSNNNNIVIVTDEDMFARILTADSLHMTGTKYIDFFGESGQTGVFH